MRSPLWDCQQGNPAPGFRLPDLAGEHVALDDLRTHGRPVLLAFVETTLWPCTALVPDLARWQDQHREVLTVALVSRGTPDENRAKVGEATGMQVLLQKDREVAEAYQVHGTPGAVLVRPDGMVGSAVAMGAEAIGRLVMQNLPRPAAPLPGSPAPLLRLPNLDGQLVNLEEFRGRRTLVLFWNPGCGHCARMLPEAQALGGHNAGGCAGGFLLVSVGTVEANRAMALRASVLLDEGFAGRAFGVSGTPSAVLVDAEGRVASPVAVGAVQVLALLGAAPPRAVAA